MVYIGPNNNYLPVIEKGIGELGLEEDLHKHLLNNCLGSLQILLNLKEKWV